MIWKFCQEHDPIPGLDRTSFEFWDQDQEFRWTLSHTDIFLIVKIAEQGLPFHTTISLNVKIKSNWVLWYGDADFNNVLLCFAIGIDRFKIILGEGEERHLEDRQLED